MATLAQLLAHHRRILVLDAASTRTQVGLLQADLPAQWWQGDEEAGTGLFTGVEAVLTAAALELNGIDAFVFCDGPGSMLGIRTVAMALRTWHALKPRPLHAYQSLAVAGRHEWLRQPRAFAVIADARRENWHVQAVGADGRMAPLRRMAAGTLPVGELVTPEHFRTWAQPPGPALPCCYDLATIFTSLREADFFQPSGAPDAFQHEAPCYRKWSAQVHSAPVR